MTVTTPDLADVPNGRYKGEYDGHLVSAKVTVVVKKHQIIEIILDEHDTQKGENAEVIPDRIVKAQSIDVDTISGATQSSNVIRKAVEQLILAY